MTGPGNLECKKILHLVGQSKVSEIHKIVKSSLQMCVANSFTSVSFPALGTGELHQQAGVRLQTWRLHAGSLSFMSVTVCVLPFR